MQPDCLYLLRGRARDSEISWRYLGHPYCDESAAIADARRLCEQFACVEVVNLLTGRVIFREVCRPIG